jgi:hypothetical protein
MAVRPAIGEASNYPFIVTFRLKTLITSLGLGVGCKGLHSVTSAKPRVYRWRMVLLTTLGELTDIIFRRSRFGGGSAGVLVGMGGVGVSLGLGRNSSIGVSLIVD